MAVKPAVTKTPERSTIQYTVGNPKKTLDVSTAATSPNIGSLPDNPHQSAFVGADVNSGTAAIGALGSGASATFSFKVSFPNLPTPIVVGVADFAQFIVEPVSIYSARSGHVENAIPGLVIASFVVQPAAYTAGNFPPSLTEVLQVSQTYTGWAALVSGTVTAIAATSAGVLTARVRAAIYDMLG